MTGRTWRDRAYLHWLSGGGKYTLHQSVTATRPEDVTDAQIISQLALLIAESRAIYSAIQTFGDETTKENE